MIWQIGFLFILPESDREKYANERDDSGEKARWFPACPVIPSADINRHDTVAKPGETVTDGWLTMPIVVMVATIAWRPDSSVAGCNARASISVRELP